MLTDLQARKLASEWHGGQWTGLYALSSSGAIIVDHNFDTLPDTFRTEDGDLVYTDDPDTLAEITAIAEIEDELSEKFRQKHSGPLIKAERTDLMNLAEYVSESGPREPQPGWSELTW